MCGWIPMGNIVGPPGELFYSLAALRNPPYTASMATEVTIGDLTTPVPGVYADLSYAPLASLPATAALAVVKEDPRFQMGVNYLFRSKAEFLAFDPTSNDDRLWADLLWKDGVASVDSLRIHNIKPTTQAVYNIPDADGDPSVILKSNAWGLAGNRVHVQGTFTSTTLELLLDRDGYSEKFRAVRESLGSVEYTGGVNSAVTLAWSASAATIASSRVLGPKVGGDDLLEEDDWGEFPVSSALTLALAVGAGAAHDENVVVTIIGKTLAGADQTVVKTIAVGDVGANVAEVFSSITSIEVTTDDNAWVGTVTVAGSKAIAFSNRAAKNVLSDIDNIPGFEVTGLTAKSRLASDADRFVATAIHAAPKLVSAYAMPIVEALRPSRLVTATRGTNGEPPTAPVAGFLTGGTEGVTANDAWEVALDTLENVDITTVLPWSHDATVAALLDDHCVQSALEGYERTAWFGLALNTSLADATAAVAAINSHRVSVVDFGFVDADGISWSPLYTALRLVGMIGFLPAGESLTNKDTRLLAGVRAYTRKERADAIRAGLVTYEEVDGVVTVLREVTSYLSDDDSNRVEGAAVRCVNFFIRDLRSVLRPKIGKKNTAAMRDLIKSIAKQRAELHINEYETLVDFRNFSAVTTESGDGVEVLGEVAPTKPLNFVPIRFGILNF